MVGLRRKGETSLPHEGLHPQCGTCVHNLTRDMNGKSVDSSDYQVHLDRRHLIM